MVRHAFGVRVSLNIKVVYLLLALLSPGLFAPPAFAQATAVGASAPEQPHTESTDLIAVFQLALEHDANYLSAQAQLQADLEGKKQALAAMLPNLNLSAQVQKTDSTRTAQGFSINSSSTPRGYTVSLRQPLFRPQIWETYKQSELNEEIAKLKFKQAKQDLILRVAKAYFGVLAAQKDMETLASQKSATLAQLNSAKRNFEVGTATITDQQEAQAKFDLIKAQEIAAQNALSIKKLDLQAITGKPVGHLADLKALTPLAWPDRKDDPDSWGSLAQSDNLQAQQAALAQMIAKRESIKAWMGHLPTLDLSAQYNNGTQQIFDTTTGRPFDVNSKEKSIGLTLTVPLFAGGATQSKVRQEAALLNKARYDAENAKTQADKAAKAALLQVTGGLSRVFALETAVHSSELALKANQTGYEVGVRINIDVLNAQQQVSSAQSDLAKAKYDTLVNMLTLESTVGQLDENSLKQINLMFKH